MAKRRKRSSAKLTRLQAQTRAIRGFNSLLICLLGLAVGSVVVATALPHQRKLEEMNLKLRHIEQEEQEVIAQKEDQEAAYKALREDPEYLEIHARDRLGMHRPGEKIYRIERDR